MENKSKRITVRLTPDELKRVRAAARKERQKPSAFIRVAVKKAVNE